jgi:hypothetical protein
MTQTATLTAPTNTTCNEDWNGAFELGPHTRGHAAAWRATGFPFEKALRWANLGVSPDCTEVTPAALRLYRRVLPGLSVVSAAALQSAHVRPVDAARYAEVGINQRNAMLRLGWSSISPQKAADYRAANITALADIQALHSAGVSANTYNDYRVAGVARVADVLRLCTAGVDALDIEQYRKLGVTSIATMLRLGEDGITDAFVRVCRGDGAVTLADVERRHALGALGIVVDRGQYSVSRAKRVLGSVLAATEAGFDEVVRRGGETEIVGQYGTETLYRSDWGENGSVVLLHAEGWRQYSKSFGARRASLSYLAGVDDGHPFAVRVPGTITTVADAIAWLEPAAVGKARKVGKRVERQGDVYAVESRCDLMDAAARGGIERHDWNAEDRVLTHPQHRTIEVSYPARLYQQRTLEMGRTNSWGAGD